MKLILEYNDGGATLMLDVGEFDPYFLGVAFQATEDKFGTIESGGTDTQEEWTMLELDGVGASLQDVAEFIYSMMKVSGIPYNE